MSPCEKNRWGANWRQEAQSGATIFSTIRHLDTHSTTKNVSQSGNTLRHFAPHWRFYEKWSISTVFNI